MTGGLGPTADDLTVSAVAAWMGVPVHRDEAFVAAMRERWEGRRGIRMPAVNEKQGDVPQGARVLENPRGTAPGFWLERNGTQIVILPGVPSEMREIFERAASPGFLGNAGGEAVTRRRVLRIAGMGESAVEEVVAPLYRKWSDDPVTILASPGEVELHLCARGDAAAADARLAAMEEDFRAVLGSRIHGADGDAMAASLGRLLVEKRSTLALAESCTGGMVSTLLTDVPGSSAYFLGTVVSYSDSSKEEMLGVAAGHPSPARRGFGRDGARDGEGRARAIRIGPGGVGDRDRRPGRRTPEKPVGTVFFAVSSAATVSKRRERRFFGGDRAMVRRDRRDVALELVRRGVAGRWRMSEPGRSALPRRAAGPGLGRERAGAGLASSGRRSRGVWTRPESWHLTLRFLGEVPHGSPREFADRDRESAAARRPGASSPGGRSCFPRAARPRVLGVGSREAAGPDALWARPRGRGAAGRLRLAPEAAPFHPHVTFARIRQPWPGGRGRALTAGERTAGRSRPGASLLRALREPARARRAPCTRRSTQWVLGRRRGDAHERAAASSSSRVPARLDFLCRAPGPRRTGRDIRRRVRATPARPTCFARTARDSPSSSRSSTSRRAPPRSCSCGWSRPTPIAAAAPVSPRSSATSFPSSTASGAGKGVATAVGAFLALAPAPHARLPRRLRPGRRATRYVSLASVVAIASCRRSRDSLFHAPRRPWSPRRARPS